MRIAAFILVVITFLPTARADTSLDKRYDNFAKSVRKEIDRPEFKAAALKKFPQTDFAPFLARAVESFEQPPHSAQKVRQIADTISNIQLSPKIQKTADALFADLTKEEEARKKRANADLNALLTSAREACLNAKTPADLDATLKALAIYQRGASDNLLDITTSDSMRGIQMFQFVKSWQDYLEARNSGDTDRARGTLYSLKQSVDPSLFSRSQVLSLPLRNPEPKTSVSGETTANVAPAGKSELPGILARLESAKLDDLADISTALARYKSSERDQQLNEILLRVYELINSRKAIEQGRISIPLFYVRDQTRTALANGYYTEKLFAAFDRLESEFRDEALLSVFKDSGLKPSAGETVDSFIQRVAEAAASAENWEYALRTLEFYRAFFPTTTAPAWVSRELGSCTTYSAARRLDEAGQFPQAILAYHDALRSAGRLTPVKIIASRLAEIRQDQPQAFVDAARLPRVVVYSQPSVDFGFKDRSMGSGAPSTYLVPRSETPLVPSSRRPRPTDQ